MNAGIHDWARYVAHEMRSPLAAIGAGLQLLRKHGTDPRLTAEVSERMERQFHQLVRLVDDLVDDYQTAHGHFSLHKRHVILSGVLEGAIEMTRPLMEHCGHELRIAACPSAVIVDGDADRLTQVVVNLLENAAYYTPHGGHIALSLEHIPGRVTIRVQDDGTGISADLLPHIFEMHMRGATHAEQRPTGAGLGLAIVRSIVEAHGGTVGAISEGEGRGSTFMVELPTVEGAAATS